MSNLTFFHKKDSTVLGELLFCSDSLVFQPKDLDDLFFQADVDINIMNRDDHETYLKLMSISFYAYTGHNYLDTDYLLTIVPISEYPSIDDWKRNIKIVTCELCNDFFEFVLTRKFLEKLNEDIQV